MCGASSPDALCKRAKELGYSGLALTDRNTLSGMWDFLHSCKRHRLKPVIGAELVHADLDAPLVCLVKDAGGYANLCNVITVLKDSRKTLNLEYLQEFQNGLIFLSSSPVFLEAGRKNGLDIAADLGCRPTAKSRLLYRWAKASGVPAVAGTAAVIAGENSRQLFALLQAIGKKTVFSMADRKNREDPVFLEHPSVYEKRFSVWPGVTAAADTLAGRCTFSGPDSGIVMPPWNNRGNTASAVLRTVAYEGACRRYGTDLSEVVVERLEYELQVIHDMGFSSYFLVVRDIVQRAHASTSCGSSRICGRGSGAASLVAYCLQITNVCPVKHNLYFERFLNPGRTDPPDIDIDFAWDMRDGVLDQVLHEHGKHAAMVSTLIRFGPRMAIRETARAFGLASGEIARVSRRLSGLHLRKGKTLATAVRDLPSLQGRELPSPWADVIDLASQLIGIPRCLSVHPGGVVITPDPVCSYVPVERAVKGVPVIQWDKDGAEEAGLVKIDLLGNRSLGVIRDAIESVRINGTAFDEEYWNPEEDPKTRRTVAQGKTMGCFYIESPAMRLLQQKAGTGDFEQLVLQSSIIRPAANEFVREYVRRLHGGKWQHLHPKLAEVLDETFGLMVYQEDVSRVAVALAGFSHVRADGLRKVMSKKDKVLRLEHYRDAFAAGCAANGVEKETEEKLWQMMMSFDGYSFCKPHSASYARVSFQAAYLKTHYPAEFMAAVLSNQGGYYSTFAYVSEAKRLGLVIQHPCVQSSTIRWQGKGMCLRVGLMAVRGLSRELMKRIVQSRGEKPFTCSLDFWQRVFPARDEAKALIDSGALDTIAKRANRTVLFWEFSQVRHLAGARRSSPLFPVQLPVPPALRDPAKKELFRREYRVLGFLCESHPLLLCNKRIKGRIRAVDCAGYEGRSVSFAGWLLSGKLVSTKSGEVMEFLTFEDESGVLETTFFPRVYRRYASLLMPEVLYLLQGTVEVEYGAVTLTVKTVRRL